ncbi:alpha/beta hydrolase family protein [Streptomyces longisporoflavus]|uniref:alpha/beta hydrolase family protein n=1 Tax=Streptomyces longisporoflavus TaxID=28044 RepID=UPI00167EA65C|nr:alpha/beta hydrolase [Streptomyces longisporoflavus]
MIRNRIRRRGAAAAVASVASVASLASLAFLTPAVADTPAVAAGAAHAPVSASAPATREDGLSLPRPSGSHSIGRDTLHLVDASRRDMWVPSSGARELMVSVFYPARRGGGDGGFVGDSAPYIGVEEAELLLKGQKLDQVIAGEQVAGVDTNARPAARPAKGRHPLVVLSPGFTLHRATLTGLAEELASRGYVVAVIDHAYESFGTEFPGKGKARGEGGALHMRTCVACAKVEDAPHGDAGEKRMMAKAARNRAADISFVVDELMGGRPRTDDGRHPDYRDLIDPRKIGAAGHSLGGNAAATAMGADHRIRAAANLDGTFFAPVPATATDRPVLMLGTRSGHTPTAEDASWPREWQRLHGWKRWLTVADSGHLTFTDMPVLGGQLGMTDPSAPLSGKRSGEITADYVTAFFDQHLRSRNTALFDGPSKENPEVAFHSPSPST